MRLLQRTRIALRSIYNLLISLRFFLHLSGGNPSRSLDPRGFPKLDGQAFNKVIHRVARRRAIPREINHLRCNVEFALRMGA